METLSGMTKMGLSLDPSQRYVWYCTGAVMVFACDTLCLDICPGDMRKKDALRTSKKSEYKSKGSFTETQSYRWIGRCGSVYMAGVQ